MPAAPCAEHRVATARRRVWWRENIDQYSDTEQGVVVAVYKVSSEVLTETAGKLTAGSKEAQDLLDGLRKLVESLGSDWEGAGAGAFNDLYAEFNSAGVQLTESLEGIASMLTKAAAYYAESESNVANAFRS